MATKIELENNLINAQNDLKVALINQANAQKNVAAAQAAINRLNRLSNPTVVNETESTLQVANNVLNGANLEVRSAQISVNNAAKALNDQLQLDAKNKIDNQAAIDAANAATAQAEALAARSLNAKEGAAAQTLANTSETPVINGDLVPSGATTASVNGTNIAFSSGIGNEFLRPTGTGPNVRDYTHASTIFRDGNYRLSPKYGFLFHVAFDLTNSRLDPTKQLEMGLMVKQVNLPKFTVETKTYNAYNRPNIVQTKLKYDPVTITFHDDSSDVVRDFWYDYMSLYYRDSDYDPTVYRASHKYTPRQKQDWGYQVARYAPDGQPERMLNSVRIYSLHQKRFTEYILVNPTITNFQHGEHQNGSNDVMQHTMTLTYETVLYNYGYVQPGSNINFATLHYDNTPSPITPQGGTSSDIDRIDHSLGKDTVGLTTWKAFDKFNGSSLGTKTGAELTQIGKNVQRGNNPFSKFQIPTLGGVSGSGVIGGSISGGLGTGAGLLGIKTTSGLNSLFGGQRGGAMSPTGASPVSGVMATAAAKVMSYSSTLFNGGTGGTTGSRTVQSNGEAIGGTTGDPVTGVPITPYQILNDGSIMTLDPNTGYQYVTDVTGLVTVIDPNGNMVRQVDSTGRTLYEIDPATGEPVDLFAAEPPTYDQAQAFDGQWTNLNTYAGNNLPSNQNDLNDFYG